MKSWKSALIGLLAVSVLIFTGPDMPSYAGKFGGSSSSGSFSSSRSTSSSSSYSKPSFSSSSVSKTTTSTWGSRSGDGVVSKPAATSSGYTKPGGTATTTTSTNVTATTTKTQTSSGYTKPGGTTTSPSSGFTKPSAPTGASATASTPATPQKVSFSGAGKSNFDKSNTVAIQKQKSADSLSAYKAEQSKFKQPEQKFDKTTYSSSTLYKSAPVYSGYNARTQITVRNNYYGGMGYHPPVYYTSFSPSYGLFDTVFMFWMIDNMNHNAEARAMAHNYQNDPGFRQFRSDLDKQSSNNAELKAKIASMDAEMAKMKDQPVNANYVPKGIPSEAIIAPQAMMSKEPAKAPLEFASGQKTGKYFMFANALKGSANTVTVKVEQTAGSLENLRLLVSGKADMAIVQSDALLMFDKEFPGQKLSSEQSVLYPEFMQLIVNSSSGIKSVNDMLDGKVEICFPKGSGSSVSWDALCAQDAKYKKIPVKYVASNDACLEEVAKNPKVAMFLVAGLRSPVMQTAEKIAEQKGTLRLASIDDTHMLDKLDTHGNKVYTYYEITKDTYPSLQKGWWFFKRDVKTLGVDAVLVLRSAWVEEYGQEALDSLTMSVLEAKSDVERTILAKK
jgi:TRAP transporter TAXI family solute receptor